MSRMIAVAAAGVCRRYGRRWALTDVSFEVPEGALVMVTGRNGSGKSTLLRVLATAIRPDRGTVRILGTDSRRGPLLSRLEEVGLADRGDDPVQSFSAGMRQRLALASVLQQQARVVLLDEPYGHLDPPGFLLVDGLLQRLRREGATVLMATHLVSRGRNLCDRGLVLEAGRLAYAGTAAQMPQPAGADGAGFAEGA